MLELAKAIFGRLSAPRDEAHEELVELATERAVDGTDPRIRAIPGYKRKLRAPVETAISYVESLPDAFHPPVAVDRSRYADDPQVWGFFGSPERVGEIFRASDELREFLDRPESALLTEVYAGMGMVREDKKILAPEIRGDIVTRDALRDTVSFNKHRVVLPSRDEASLLDAFMERAFMTLVECALERVVALRNRRSHLQQDRADLARKLETLHARGLGVQAMAGGAPGGSDEIEALEQRLETIEAEIKGVAATTTTLDDYLGEIAGVLSSPEEHVRCSRASVRMTRLGFKATPQSEDPGEAIDYTEIAIGESERFTARFVRYLDVRGLRAGT